MTVPVLVLMLAAMVTAMAVSLRDHAAHAAATDLAELRAEHAADAFLAGCITAGGCVRPAAEDINVCAATEAGVVVKVQVSWNPVLWKSLTPVTADRIIAYDRGLDTQFKARVGAAVPAC